jgi:hypothetical protein
MTARPAGSRLASNGAVGMTAPRHATTGLIP